MTSVTAQRLDAVRSDMLSQTLDAFIVPRADEYLGEYVPERNERLHWLTGFTGSAGMAIVLKESAAIFIDGRYTVQVKQQVDSAQFDYQSLTDTPQIPWLIAQLSAGARIGYDPRLHTLSWQQQAEAQCQRAGIELVAVADNPIDRHWQERPAASSAAISLFSEQSAGISSTMKREQIGKAVAAVGADVALISALDSFCWLLNIRGSDVPRLPVVLGTALLYKNGEMTLFTDLAKLPEGIQAHVGAGVSFMA